MANARDYGTVRTMILWLGLGYLGEFSGYAFPIEQSDLVSGTGHRDIIHHGLDMVRYR